MRNLDEMTIGKKHPASFNLNAFKQESSLVARKFGLGKGSRSSVFGTGILSLPHRVVPRKNLSEKDSLSISSKELK